MDETNPTYLITAEGNKTSRPSLIQVTGLQSSCRRLLCQQVFRLQSNRRRLPGQQAWIRVLRLQTKRPKATRPAGVNPKSKSKLKKWHGPDRPTTTPQGPTIHRALSPIHHGWSC